MTATPGSAADLRKGVQPGSFIDLLVSACSSVVRCWSLQQHGTACGQADRPCRMSAMASEARHTVPQLLSTVHALLVPG